MATFAPCSTCGNTVDVAFACPYCSDSGHAEAPVRPSSRLEPASSPPPVARTRAGRRVRLIDYRSTYNTGVFLQLLLGVYLAVAAWSLLAAMPYLEALTDLRDSGVVDDVDQLLAVESGYGLAASFEGLVYLLVATVWMVWFYRSYKNQEALGRRCAYAAWWSIFGWVIPFVSFYRPRQVAGDLWVESRALSRADPGDGWRPKPDVPWFLNAWWGLFVIANLTIIANRFNQVDDTVESYITVLRWEMAGVVAVALCVPFALAVVRSINNRQAALARSLDAALARRL